MSSLLLFFSSSPALTFINLQLFNLCIHRCYDLIYHSHCFLKKFSGTLQFRYLLNLFTLRYLDTFVVGSFFCTVVSVHSHGIHREFVVASSINPRIVGGRLFLNATSETHAGEVLFRLASRNSWNKPAPSLLMGYAKVEPLSISKLNKFVLTAKPQVATGIKMERGWCYVSCFMCTRKLQRTVISFTFVSRNNTKAIGVLRYIGQFGFIFVFQQNQKTNRDPTYGFGFGFGFGFSF
ncbi:unnamed protein product [Brassica napus]|uniref:(rape) hypothetical protein n=1 Tax=Brassica napus TaxID=3708 RepID=A0A816T4N3_BRANA|nr:unnamed protein product [Brassica napus]